MNDISKTVGGFRSAIQDLLVPELKAIQTELKHHSEEFARIDKHFEAIDKRFEAVDKRFEDLRREMNQRFEAVFESISGCLATPAQETKPDQRQQDAGGNGALVAFEQVEIARRQAQRLGGLGLGQAAFAPQPV